MEDAEKGEVAIPDENGFEPAIFNACMALTSVYLAMLASAWYTGDIAIRPEAVKDNTSMFTAWVFTGSIWAGYALFIYVLVIPIVNDSRTYCAVCSTHTAVRNNRGNSFQLTLLNSRAWYVSLLVQ